MGKFSNWLDYGFHILKPVVFSLELRSDTCAYRRQLVYSNRNLGTHIHSFTCLASLGCKEEGFRFFLWGWGMGEVLGGGTYLMYRFQFSFSLRYMYICWEGADIPLIYIFCICWFVCPYICICVTMFYKSIHQILNKYHFCLNQTRTLSFFYELTYMHS